MSVSNEMLLFAMVLLLVSVRTLNFFDALQGSSYVSLLLQHSQLGLHTYKQFVSLRVH